MKPPLGNPPNNRRIAGVYCSGPPYQQSGYRGSTAIKGEVDAMYLLTADNGGKNSPVRKGRDGAPFTLKYAVDF